MAILIINSFNKSRLKIKTFQPAVIKLKANGIVIAALISPFSLFLLPNAESLEFAQKKAKPSQFSPVHPHCL
jgi:hypothetical protein